MRRLGTHGERAIAGTLLVHAAAIAWLATRPDRPPPPPVAELHAVELWDGPLALPPDAPSPAPTPDSRSPSDATAAAQPDADAEPQPIPAPPRGDRRPSRRESARAPAEPGSDEHGVVVQPSEADAAATAGTSRTGLALHGLRGHRTSDDDGGPPPSPANAARMLARVGGDAALGDGDDRKGEVRSLAEAGFKRKRDGRWVYVDRKAGFRATLLPDGRVKFREVVTPAHMPGMAEAMRAAAGEELYKKEKKALLERTHALRVQMAMAHAERNIEGRLRRLYRDCLEIWQEPSTPAADRREQLFRMWDDCEEGLAADVPDFVASSQIDETRRAAGDEAREKILDFVRKHLPRGSADAYSAEELRRLNARRRSRQRFEPY